MTMTTDPLIDQDLEASDKAASKDDASIFGGESDDVPSSAFIRGDNDEMIEHGIFPLVMEESDYVPSSAFIHGDSDEMIEHGIFPLVMEESDDVPSSSFIHGDGDEMVEYFTSTTVTYDDLSDLCHHIESESDLTTSPIYDVLPQSPCEESHNPHHLSEMSDSTI